MAWCLAVGVRLATLWYAVYGFRADANEVLSLGSRDAPVYRAAQLAAILVLTGMVLIIGWFLANLPHVWRRSRAVKSLKNRIGFVLCSKLYRQMYANTGIATDSARHAKSERMARLLAKPCRRLFIAKPMPDLQMPA